MLEGAVNPSAYTPRIAFRSQEVYGRGRSSVGRGRDRPAAVDGLADAAGIIRLLDVLESTADGLREREAGLRAMTRYGTAHDATEQLVAALYKP